MGIDKKSIDLESSALAMNHFSLDSGDEFVSEPIINGQVTLEKIKKSLELLHEDLYDKSRISKSKQLSKIENGEAIISEFDKVLQREFPNTWMYKRKQVVNLIKYVSRLLSTIYKKPPVRTLKVKKSETLGQDDLDQQNELIEMIYRRGKINKSFQTIERAVKWSKSVLVRVMYNHKRKRFSLKGFSPQYFQAIFDKYGDVVAAVELSHDKADGSIDYTVCTAQWWYQFKRQDDKLTHLGSQENDIKMLPYFLVNDVDMTVSERKLPHPDITQKHTCENINLILTDLLHLSKNCAFKQLYGIDVGKFPEGTSPEAILDFQSEKKDYGEQGHQAQVGVLEQGADFDGIVKAANFILNLFAMSHGLPANTFSVEKKTLSSGIALKINNAPLIEMRESEEEKYSDIENELFPIIKAYHNLYKDRANGHTEGEISEKVELVVNFVRSDDAFESPVENRKQAILEVSEGLRKRSDYVKLLYPFKTTEECKQYLKEVQDEDKELNIQIDLDSFPEEEEPEEDESEDGEEEA